MYGDDVILAGVDGNRYTAGYPGTGDGVDNGFTQWHPDHGTDGTNWARLSPCAVVMVA